MTDISELEKEENYKTGMDFVSKNDVTNALLAFEKSVREDPEHFLAWNNIGFLLYNAKYLKEAENAFNKAIEILPGYVDAHVNLFYLCKSDERLDEAKKHLETAKALAPDNEEIQGL